MLGYPVGDASDSLADPQLPRAAIFWRALSPAEGLPPLRSPAASRCSTASGPRCGGPRPAWASTNARDLPRVRRLFGRAGAASSGWRRMTEIATRLPRRARSGALSGIRVVELGFAAAGPLVGKYLANFGAEVIRLESRLAAGRVPDDVPHRSRTASSRRTAPRCSRSTTTARRSATINLKDPRGCRPRTRAHRQGRPVSSRASPRHGRTARPRSGDATRRAPRAHRPIELQSGPRPGRTRSIRGTAAS